MFTKMLPVIGVGTLLTIAGITASSAAEETPSQPSPEAQKATVVSTTVKRPPKVIHRAFKVKLITHPSQGQVLEIINHEARLWGVSPAALTRRARCESGLNWWATNGQYQGVLQFGANAFYRGMSTIRTRRYVDTVIRYRRMHSRVYRQWSDGRITRNKGRIVRQQMVIRTVGYIPRNPYIADVYAQIRIGAQALRGISAVRSSEWSCGA
jgi:hypothetical protein